MIKQKRGRPQKSDFEKKVTKVITLSRHSVEKIERLKAQYGFSFSQAVDYLIITGEKNDK